MFSRLNLPTLPKIRIVGTSGNDKLDERRVGESDIFGRLRIGPSATNSSHRVIYDSVTGRVFFDSDGSGVTQAQLVVTIPVNLNLTPPNIEIF